MSRLTIKVRIIAYMALIGVALAGFMGSFFPTQAARLGSRLVADSAVTVSRLFAANIEPAYDALGFGGEEIIRTSVQNLVVEESADVAARAHQPITIRRITVYDAQGVRLDGYQDSDTPILAEPITEIRIVDEDVNALVVHWPVTSGGQYKGFFTVEFSKESLHALVSQHRRIGLASALLALIVTVIVGYFVSRSISAPIQRLADAMHDLEGGAGDLTFRLQVESDDEIGQLARHFNAFLTKLQNIVRDVAGNAQTLATASEQLSSISTRMVANSEKMRDRATAVSERTKEMTANVTVVAASARDANTHVASVSSAMEEMSQSMGQVSLAAEAVASNAVTVERSLRDISENILDIRINTEKSSEISTRGSSKVAPVQDLMAKLTDSAEATSKILTLIQKVADQTNLLSLNASIEAASAGDAGKGFAVVAHEVKDLARETTQATKRIEVQIGEMQAYTRGAVEMIGEIVDLMESAHTISGSIAQAVEDQTTTTAHVSDSTSDTRKMIEEVTQNIGEASRVATDVASKAAELARGVSEISASAFQTAEGANQVAEYIETVREAAVDSTADADQVRVRSRELTDLSTALKHAVDQFRV
jgi:methyl-accepting chemotaxis protein